MRTFMRLVVTLLAVAGLAAGCSDDDGGVVSAGDGDGTTTTADPDTAVSSLPGTDDAGGDDIVWTRIEPTEDLVNPVVATPDELVPDPGDPNAVLVRFYGGVQECYGARATVVEQSAQTVRIRLETGGRPDAGDIACIEIAEAQELQVVLDAPVASRILEAVTP